MAFDAYWVCCDQGQDLIEKANLVSLAGITFLVPVQYRKINNMDMWTILEQF